MRPFVFGAKLAVPSANPLGSGGRGGSMRSISDSGISDAVMSSEAIPWVPQAPGVAFKPLRLSPKAGTWANLLRVESAGRVSRHRHLGAVQAWVLAGSWRYLEHDWIAHPGDYVFEGPGDVHTLVVEPGAVMETLFVIDGPYEYVNDEGVVTGTESAESKLAAYRSYCQANGLEVAPIIY
jgi:2,4'-dihydroxyacetophenone dioxygenase